jgi:hypothetical protein
MQSGIDEVVESGMGGDVPAAVATPMDGGDFESFGDAWGVR